MSISVFSTAVGLILYLKRGIPYLLIPSFLTIIVIFSLWMRDIIREATYQGAHTLRTIYTLKFGFILFVLSEWMFFVSFFWAFFHSGLSPSIEIGVKWPPVGVQAIYPWGLPAWNTVILLWSGMWVTAAHHSVKGGNRERALETLNYAILLGILFSLCQYFEFRHAPFTIADSVYGSCFFLLTGFHGLHVVVGTIFLIVQYKRLQWGHFTLNRHLGLECAIIYWHFVDLIWLLVFAGIYIWSYYEWGTPQNNSFSFILEKEFPTYGQMGFQTSATPQAEAIVSFYHFVATLMCGVLFFSFYWLINILIRKRHNFNRSFYEDGNLEFCYTAAPMVILGIIAGPSVCLLFLLDEFIHPLLSMKVVGHQWYWDYEIGKKGTNEIEFSSYMVPTEELLLGQMRLYEVTQEVFLPVGVKIKVGITSADVIHSWVVNSFGVKVDAVPGHLNNVGFFIKRIGNYFGMCSEICGSLHAFMPINVKAVNIETFLVWHKNMQEK